MAYSGHDVRVQVVGGGTDEASKKPSVGIALAKTADDRDLQSIDGLNELRPLFTDLARNTYQFLALINACYGGDIFGLASAGGNVNDMTSRSSEGLTAGPDDKTVISLGAGHGSLFSTSLLRAWRRAKRMPMRERLTWA